MGNSESVCQFVLSILSRVYLNIQSQWKVAISLRTVGKWTTWTESTECVTRWDCVAVQPCRLSMYQGGCWCCWGWRLETTNHYKLILLWQGVYQGHLSNVSFCIQRLGFVVQEAQCFSISARKFICFLQFVLFVLLNLPEAPACLTHRSIFFHCGLFILVANTCLKIMIFIQTAHMDCGVWRQSSSLSKHMNSAYMRLYFSAYVKSETNLYSWHQC